MRVAPPPPRARSTASLRGRVDRQDVVAVDAHPRIAVGQRLDRQGLGHRLRNRRRRRGGPLLMQHEDHRDLEDAGEVQGAWKSSALVSLASRKASDARAARLSPAASSSPRRSPSRAAAGSPTAETADRTFSAARHSAGTLPASEVRDGVLAPEARPPTDRRRQLARPGATMSSDASAASTRRRWPPRARAARRPAAPPALGPGARHGQGRPARARTASPQRRRAASRARGPAAPPAASLVRSPVARR